MSDIDDVVGDCIADVYRRRRELLERLRTEYDERGFYCASDADVYLVDIYDNMLLRLTNGGMNY